MFDEENGSSGGPFGQRLIAKAPRRVQNVLTDKGEERTDRCCATGERDLTGRYRLDGTGATHGIDHRWLKPRHPRMNGGVERGNGRISAPAAMIRPKRPRDHPEALGAPESASDSPARVGARRTDSGPA
jgi:hypothetical protein